MASAAREAAPRGATSPADWVSRTEQWAAKNRGRTLSDEQAASSYELQLEPLPCWAHWDPECYQRQIAEILKRIEEETAERHRRDQTSPLGVAKILAQHSHASPNKIKRAPAPLVHAASKKMRRDFYSMYAAFVGAFYQAVERLKASARDPGFPDGAFPPPLLLAAPG